MSEPTPDEIREVEERARCVFSHHQVQAALDGMAERIAERLRDSDPLLLCVMTGAVMTTAELALRLSFPLQIDYLHATRYGDSTRGAGLQWLRQPTRSLTGRTVLIVDDILDEGATLAAILDYCREQGAAEVLSAVLVDKRHERRQEGVAADFVGLTSDDHYLYGYGMDYRGYLRNARGIFAVAEQDY